VSNIAERMRGRRKRGEPSPLTSPALGSAVGELVGMCDQPRPARSPLPPPPQEPAIALALSGGGFRATVAALGVLRFLADAGLLARIRYSSSVSGGSVANGLFACRHEALQEEGFQRAAFDAHVLVPFVDTISSRSVSKRLLPKAWRLVGDTNRTELLADEFDRLFFEHRLLADMSGDCRFIFNAANTSTSVRFVFERDLIGDYVLGYVPTTSTRLRVADAVAASAAVPGLLAPLELDDITFPCQRGRTARLIDGGAYDNMGLEAVDDRHDALLIAINAGGLFVTGQYGRVPLVRDLQLAQSLLYRQSTAQRRRWMVERFKAWEAAHAAGDPIPEWGRRGVLFGLATTLEPSPAWQRANPTLPDPRVAFLNTSFDKFSRTDCRQLVYAGWWLTGASLTRYHPDLLGDRLPTWKDPL
jgi:NTE family protein